MSGVNLPTVQRVYEWYAPFYDRLFGALFDAGRRRAVDHAVGGGGRRILEVGVGTGLSLPYYPAGCRVVGIDVCQAMLQVARERAARDQLATVEALLEMDAEQLAFDDGSFDAIVAMYVATVVPNPARLLAEMARVCAPGGTIVIVNHFESDQPLMRLAERALTPLSSIVGFRTAYPLASLPAPPELERLSVERVNALGLWKIVRYERRAAVAATRARPRPVTRLERARRDAARTIEVPARRSPP
jgi:phosphatidylethanolamine/phosphatidyl-N-methylethanolamine N-methyltransferase